MIKFCTACGGDITIRIPVDDDHKRAVCTSCGLVHYENPKMVVGSIPVLGDSVLLCKRNIEPRKGKWTLPAGFLELSETVQEGAFRETLEETRAKVEILAPYRMCNLVFVGQVYLMFLAKMTGDSFGPTKESSEVRLFTEQEIPWDEIAFKVIYQTLKDFFADRALSNNYPFLIREITPPAHLTHIAPGIH